MPKFLCRHQILIFSRKNGGPSAIRLARISNSFLNHCTIQVGITLEGSEGGGCSRSFGRFTSETSFNNTGNVAVENKLYIVSCVIFCTLSYVSVLILLFLSFRFVISSFVRHGWVFHSHGQVVALSHEGRIFYFKMNDDAGP